MTPWHQARPHPFAVLHGDYRLDNLLFDPDGADVVAVDWQTLAVGPPARDLAYFLGTSLTVDDRRAAERELVAELPRGALRPRRVGLRGPTSASTTTGSASCRAR